MLELGFKNMAKLHNYIVNNKYGAILMEFIDYEQVYGFDTTAELITYAYHLLNVSTTIIINIM